MSAQDKKQADDEELYDAAEPHTRYGAGAAATMRTTIRSTALKGRAANRTCTGSVPFSGPRCVMPGCSRVSHGLGTEEGRDPRRAGIPAWLEADHRRE